MRSLDTSALCHSPNLIKPLKQKLLRCSEASMLVWTSFAGKQWILRSGGSGRSGQLYSSADSVAEYSSAGQFSNRIFNTAMAFQTGKDLQRAQLTLTFPSGSYLKENENVHCSITVRTAYSKHYSAFHSASISLHNHNQHYRYFTFGTSLPRSC